MKPVLALSLTITALLLTGCTTDPKTGMNTMQKIGYVLQCTDGCPPLPNKTNNNADQQESVKGKDSKVYSANECTGPVIMGECHGAIIPQSAYHPTCHGEWLNGQCTGPMF